jgi:hypothetical protein
VTGPLPPVLVLPPAPDPPAGLDSGAARAAPKRSGARELDVQAEPSQSEQRIAVPAPEFQGPGVDLPHEGRAGFRVPGDGFQRPVYLGDYARAEIGCVHARTPCFSRAHVSTSFGGRLPAHQVPRCRPARYDELPVVGGSWVVKTQLESTLMYMAALPWDTPTPIHHEE